MSDSISSSLPFSSLDFVLTDIDNRTKTAVRSTNILSGPFGVLNFEGSTAVKRSITDDDSSSPVRETAQQAKLCSDEPQHTHQLETRDESSLDCLEPASLDLFMGIDSSLQWHDLFGQQIGDVPESFAGPAIDLVDTANSISTTSPDTSVFGLFDYSVCINDPTQTVPGVETSNDLVVTNPQSFPLSSISETTEVQTRELLRHFKNHVIGSLTTTPFTRKSIFESLHFNEALSTFANIESLGTLVSSARSANLYAVLAISAYHQSQTGQNDVRPDVVLNRRRDIYTIAASKAKKCLQRSLKHETDGAGKAKYKDQLMAILALMTLSIISGQQNDARALLIDAERLVRLRGLTKRKVSRKARLLHHMYTWYRIIGESTYVLHDYSSLIDNGLFAVDRLAGLGQNRTEPREQPTSRGTDNLDDFLRLENTQVWNSAGDNGFKGEVAGLQDIHLEDSREDPNTMYDCIFGVPETWLSLLSQTTRLANCLDATKAVEKLEPGIKDTLDRRAASLEAGICSLAAKFIPSIRASPASINASLHRALISALVIFFYRRIRNVNAWILQSHVETVISALNDCIQGIDSVRKPNWTTVWPAFIAGGEAATSESRDQIMYWLEYGEIRTGFSCYGATKDLLQELWNAKGDPRTERGGVPQPTWMSLCRERKLWLMACR